MTIRLNSEDRYYEILFVSNDRSEIESLISAVSGTNSTLGLTVDPVYPIIERCEHGIDVIADSCWYQCEPVENENEQ